MSTPNTSRPSETDWARIDAMTDEEIDTSDIPPLTEEFFKNATWRIPKPSVAVTVRVEPEVLSWFQAQGENYDLRMAAALRIYAQAHREIGVQAQP